MFAKRVRFDAISDAAIELVGIPRDLRRNVDCSSNCSMAMLFFGDCREHAIILTALFDFWQNEVCNALLSAARAASTHAWGLQVCPSLQPVLTCSFVDLII